MKHRRMHSVIVQTANEVLNCTNLGNVYVCIVHDAQGGFTWIKFDKSKDEIYSFNLFTKEVVHLRGRAARKKFSPYIRLISHHLRTFLRQKRKSESERKKRMKGQLLC